MFCLALLTRTRTRSTFLEHIIENPFHWRDSTKDKTTLCANKDDEYKEKDQKY